MLKLNRILLNSTKKILNAARFESSSCRTIDYIDKSVHELRVSEDIGLRAASLNWKYILDRDNLARIDLNNKNRKGTGDINLVVITFKVSY